MQSPWIATASVRLQVSECKPAVWHSVPGSSTLDIYLVLWYSFKSIIQSIDQSINQSINQSIHPSIQSINQSINQSVNQSINPSVPADSDLIRQACPIKIRQDDKTEDATNFFPGLWVRIKLARMIEISAC